ncbi:MAG TPA: O-antigen ligase [Edaphocola sp.]|nr:O-antigen ligase [Edaphocola sp.]
MYKKQIKINIIPCKTFLWGINIICFLQAGYGLLQFVDWFPSNHYKFSITGSFDNPAGFAAVLSLFFPISLFLVVKSKKTKKWFAIIILIIITSAVCFSLSRTGILSIVISMILFLMFDNKLINKIRQLKYCKLLSILTLICLVFGISILYYMKKDSANGRILIWKVSSIMIKDKPVFGHGYGAFKAKYMDYQAKYFKENTESKFALLADNVKHPFNEFLKVAVEFGIIGLMVILIFLLFIFKKITKSKNENKNIVLNGLASFLIFACFSYPLQYIAVWLFISFYCFLLLPSNKIKILNNPISIITRITIAFVCVFSLLHIYQHICSEIKWKEIATNSLHGKTNEMLSEYKKLYSTSLKWNPFFLYNYGAELNIVEEYTKSINILTECKKHFNDYDLQMIMADNYNKNNESEKAIQIYQHASNMIPCRFIPLYQIFKIHKKNSQTEKALQYAWKIKNKKVKIPSSTVSSIKAEIEDFLKE